MSFQPVVSPDWIVLLNSSAQVPFYTPDLTRPQDKNDNIKVRIYPNWYKDIALEWSIPEEPPTSSYQPRFGPCTFNVYFSEASEGPYTKLNPYPLPETARSYDDLSTQEFSKFDKGWYIVEAVQARSGARIKSPPTTWLPEQASFVKLRAIEIQRREDILLRNFVGIKSFVFKKIHYGPHCPDCWDERTSQLTNDFCVTCFGTGYKDGYYSPVPCYFQYETTTNTKNKTYLGRLEPNQIGGWTLGLIEVSVDDLVLRVGDWGIYRVDEILPTELQGNTVRAICKLAQLGKKDVEYKLLEKYREKVRVE